MLFRLEYARRTACRLAVILFVSVVPLLFANTVQVNKEKVSAETVPKKPAALQILDAESLQLGNILDREQRDFSFRLRNGLAKTLLLKRVRVNCPCLSLLEAPAELTLAPGSECQVKARLDAGKIKVSKFDRVIMIEVEGEELQLVHVTGERVQMLDFEPAPGIDLGTFAGVDVPWTRTIRIKSRFAGNQVLELLPPPENEHFAYKLERLSPTEYQLEFTPKLPLPKGSFKHIVDIPTRGVERYGAIKVGLFGTVTGWLLALDNPTLLIDLKTVQPGKSFTREVKVLAKSKEGMDRSRRISPATRTNVSADKLANVQLVSAEEEVAGSLNKLETWEKIATEIEMALPTGVTLEKIPQEDGLVLKMTFPEDFFSQRLRSTVQVSFQKKVIDRLRIVGWK